MCWLLEDSESACGIEIHISDIRNNQVWAAVSLLSYDNSKVAFVFFTCIIAGSSCTGVVVGGVGEDLTCKSCWHAEIDKCSSAETQMEAYKRNN